MPKGVLSTAKIDLLYTNTLSVFPVEYVSYSEPNHPRPARRVPIQGCSCRSAVSLRSATGSGLSSSGWCSRSASAFQAGRH